MQVYLRYSLLMYVHLQDNCVYAQRRNLSEKNPGSMAGYLPVLGELDSLVSLNLGFTNVSGTFSTSWTKNWVNLQVLNLSHTAVTGSVEPLAALKQLRSLDLSYTLVSGSVEKLADLSQFESWAQLAAGLRHTNVTHLTPGYVVTNAWLIILAVVAAAAAAA